ncbi:MAG: DUF364 domain-containing protein [Deltaproteobacteria bacterium]|jgi:uncharacterized protein (DUF4213/DUF364 family)|nr:DUF364 domain-containing protein [Deltaproteobacteria bacterium]
MGTLARPKWLFYDFLLDLVPSEARVKNCVTGEHWVMVETDSGGCGLAHFLKRTGPTSAPDPKSFLNRPLSELASLVKSWDNSTAAMGLAAINAVANANLQDLKENPAPPKSACAFDFFLDRTRGRRVAVVGHFPNLDKIADVAKLTILERNPQPGDLPDPTAEYVLDEQDVVFLTGTTIINKTLPRLMELAQGREVYLVGPSVPMFPELFKFGFASLSGTMVINPESMAQAVSQGLSEEIFTHGGLMVNLLKENYA